MNLKIKRRYKDYPPNVPRKLFKLLKEFNFDRSKTSAKLGINSGYLSQLLNKGIEPTDATPTGRRVRKALFLRVHKIQAIKEKRIQKQRPQFINEWVHLSIEERHQVVKQYLDWKKKSKI